MLRYRIMAPAQRLVKSIGSWGAPSGEWRLPGPSVSRQANSATKYEAGRGYASFFCSAIVRNGGHSASIERAINWLLRSNNDDGGWRDECSSNDEPDILTTILVVDSLRRAGAPTDHESIIRGENVLLSYQDATGYWQTLRLWFEFPTALAVEYLPSKDERGVLPNEYLPVVKEAYSKKRAIVYFWKELQTHSLPWSPPVTVLEHFLYGMMLQDQKAEFHREGKDYRVSGSNRCVGNDGEAIKYNWTE